MERGHLEDTLLGIKFRKLANYNLILAPPLTNCSQKARLFLRGDLRALNLAYKGNRINNLTQQFALSDNK